MKLSLSTNSRNGGKRLLGVFEFATFEYFFPQSYLKFGTTIILIYTVYVQLDDNLVAPGI